MYAVIQTGGKQYKVAEGAILRIEKLEVEVGATHTFDEVLLVGGKGEPKVGNPMLSGASVTAEIVSQGRGPKLIAFKKKRRKGYSRKIGHRQPFTEVKVTKIQAG